MIALRTMLQVWYRYFGHSVSTGCLFALCCLASAPVDCLIQACVHISEHPLAQDQSLGEIVSITQVSK